MPSIHEAIKNRILILDGAMGTMIQRYKLEEADYRGEAFKDHSCDLKGNNDLLCLTQPKYIEEIHTAYLEAGADILETNTFNANAFSMADYQLQHIVYDLNVAAVKLARKACEAYTAKDPSKPRFVAGVIGPTGKAASLSPDVNDPGFRAVTFDELVECYTEQLRGLVDGGCDLVLIETVFDTLNSKAAIFATLTYFEENNVRLPIMVSGTITDRSGRTLTGQVTEAFWNSVSHGDLFSIGLNCALGAAELKPYITDLARNATCWVSAHPNAGLPNELGEYDESPEAMAKVIEPFAAEGLVNIIGGCCGTSPDHIREIAKVAAKHKPRVIPDIPRLTRLSGLEPLTFRPELTFVNIGERTNITGSPKFARIIKEGNLDEALKIAQQQVDAGALIIDINMDEGMIDSEDMMRRFLNLVAAEPDICKVPIMIDSSKWSVIEAGLKCVQGKGIVNSISLKEGEEVFKERARKIRKYGFALICMAFDEQGQADTYERKIEICERSYNILTKDVGFPPEDIIFDPNILTIGTGLEEHNNYAVNFIETCRFIKKNLPHAHITGGVSNISFSFRGNNVVREAIHACFLYHAIKAGMDSGIVNPALLTVYQDIPADLLERVEDLVLNRREDATERLLEFAEQFKGQDNRSEEKKLEWREKSVEERLSHALVNGLSDYVDEDIAEIIPKYDRPLQIIEGPLMDGMKIVGDLFGSGQMFLPQVVKSARVMKKAVAILTPLIELEKKGAGGGPAGKVLMATVKGDVHDIGKNIVGVVLGCNNYEIVDLGVLVPLEKILDEAKKHEVDVIGLSGLITPSLDEMVYVAKEMQSRKLTTPLLIGGATTSRIHTAVKIDPVYDGPVIHVTDASRSVGVVSQLLNQDTKASYVKEIKDKYQQARDEHASKKQTVNYLPLEQARQNKFSCDWNQVSITKPSFIGNREINDVQLEEIQNYIDWSPFFHTWELRGKYPDILKDPVVGAQATELFNDAQKMLKEVVGNKILSAKAVIGFYPANSCGDDIEIYEDDSRSNVLKIFHTLRQQSIRKDQPNFALSDYIAPKESGVKDYIGFFASTAGIGIDAHVRAYEKDHDDYNAIMLKAIADRLAEAFAELLHEKVRKEFWGYSPDENCTNDELIKMRYRGIRPAPGYPACPEHTEKRSLFDLLNAEEAAGVTLTENFAMLPAAAVSGLYFAHPEARYFAVGKVEKDQVEDYAKRKGMSLDEAERWLSPNLAYSAV